MKNMLIIGTGFKPYENANGICLDKIIRQLSKSGYLAVYVDYESDGQQHEIREDGTVLYRARSAKHIVNNESTISSKGRAIRICKQAKGKIVKRHPRILFPFDSISKIRNFCKVCNKLCMVYNIDTVIMHTNHSALYMPGTA